MDADPETDISSNHRTQKKSVQFITEDLLMTENRITNVVVCPPTSKGHHSKISEAIIKILICDNRFIINWILNQIFVNSNKVKLVAG